MSILSQQKQSQNTDFPNIRPSLDLRFALAKKLDPRITFTRGSTGTRINESGLIEVVGVNQPRFDYDPVTGECRGLLIEESRTNLMTGSDDFGPTYWSKVTSVGVSTNVVTSPDGTITADKFTENTLSTGSSAHKVIARSFTLSASTTYTFSIFVKSAERTNIMMHLRKSDYTTRFGGFFNLATKTFTSETTAGATLVSSSITPLPNDWYRISVSGDIGANTAAVTTLYLCNSSNSFSYAGDGTSGIYIWGAQLEAGAFPTSYIPTTASTVTRSADVATMTGTNFSSWYNQSEGTLYANIIIPYRVSTGARTFALDNGTVAYMLDITNTSTGVALEALENSRYRTIANVSNASSVKMKQAVIYSTIPSPTQRICINETLSAIAKTYLTTSNYINLRLGTQVNNAAYLNGTISRLTYYPIAITQNQLINLTS